MARAAHSAGLFCPYYDYHLYCCHGYLYEITLIIIILLLILLVLFQMDYYCVVVVVVVDVKSLLIYEQVGYVFHNNKEIAFDSTHRGKYLHLSHKSTGNEFVLLPSWEAAESFGPLGRPDLITGRRKSSELKDQQLPVGFDSRVPRGFECLCLGSFI